ncbi:MAG TPA: hypothetical protein VN238_08065 [Solirubrobacteraceae bacterium]|nr:hypothetical protein [Solirubrobacteraceae bacterium]
MPYRLFGSIHATTYSLLHRLRGERGQGTVEYVAIILLVATIFAAVIGVASSGSFNLHTKITQKITDVIEGLKFEGKGAAAPKPKDG